ncbi:MAG: hypothetical protein Fur0014_15140 [Rubrivivax sp.]
MRRRDLLPGLLLAPWWPGGKAFAQLGPGVELSTLALQRDEGALALEFAVRLTLSRAVEDALMRGMPVYFVAQAELFRRRWYWRDERIARVRRTWRLAYQPLTGQWRVSLGALTQTYVTLPEALAALSAAGRWKVADLDQIDPDSRHYVEFEYRLDTSQLPSPMQLGLPGQSDWVLRIERTLNVP